MQVPASRTSGRVLREAVTSATEALRIAHAAGLTVIVAGEELVLKANAEPSQVMPDAAARGGTPRNQWSDYNDR